MSDEPKGGLARRNFMARRWSSSGRGIDLIDINRAFPATSARPTQRRATPRSCSAGFAELDLKVPAAAAILWSGEQSDGSSGGIRH
jgi:hypothetical protein